jgi:hypothetical protein
MVQSLTKIIKGPFVIDMFDDGSTSIDYRAFSNATPCRFSPPILVLNIDGKRITRDIQWRLRILNTPDRPVQMMTELEGILIRANFDVHPIHKIPTLFIAAENVSNTAKRNVDLELTFRLERNSSYAVLSSSDNINLMEEDSSEVRAVFTVPRVLSVSLDKLTHISSIVFRKHENVLPSLNSHSPRTRRNATLPEDWRDGTVNVDASPAYRFLCPLLEPKQRARIFVRLWFLRTMTDSCGFSGLAYAIPYDDWKATLACIAAPTHIKSDGFIVEKNVGLLSPIEFYKEYTLEGIERAIHNLIKGADTSAVYLIHPESASDEQIEQMHNSLQERLPLFLLSIPASLRSMLAYKLRESICDLLSGDTAAYVPKATKCIAISTEISVEAINAAVYGEGDLIACADVEELCAMIAAVRYTTVQLVGHTAEFERQLKAALGLHIPDITVERFQPERTGEAEPDGTEWAFREAARQTIANAALSVFAQNNLFYLQALEETYLTYCNLNDIPVPETVRLSTEPAYFAEIAAAVPDQTVRSAVYASIGPPAMVLGVVDGERWHDAVLAGSFARAKKLPAYFLKLDDSTMQAFLPDVRQLDDAIRQDDMQEIAAALDSLELKRLGSGAMRALLYLPRKALTIFAPKGELPWELLSWPGVTDSRILVGSYLDTGRIGAGGVLNTARAVWRSVAEAREPMFASERVLFAWDAPVDGIIGDSLEDTLGVALSEGFKVDVLVPLDRYNRILSRHGQRGNLVHRAIATKPKLLQLLGSETYAMIFLAAHGGEPETVGQLEFAGKVLLDQELPQMSGHPLCILNSCWTGRAVYDEVQRTNAGIAIALLDNGAFQVLAPTYPVSGVAAGLVSRAILTHGFTHSAARVLRQLKQQIAHSPTDYAAVAADLRWFIAYGDSTAVKFFNIDGIAEMEDVAEKVSRMFPATEGFTELPKSVRLRIIDHWHRQTKVVLSRAKHWGEVALNVIVENESYWGSIGKTLRMNAEAEHKRVAAFVDRTLTNVERMAVILRSHQ